MGKASKRKGRAQEYLLRDFLRLRGWQAERVYASGAIAGLPGDVKASKDGKELLFEMKSRKNAFKKIYELLDAHVRELGDDMICIAIPGNRHLCISVSTSLDAVLGGNDTHTIVTNHPLYEKFKRTFGKLVNLEKLVKNANILAVKDDRRPLIFIRFI